ncbi:MAG: Diacylglycerol kinase [Bacteroidetes bacterium 38_7]|nr:MAG: Diacylglycerol kinase [Bacteroidetes bacterium 38_7]HAL65966.1 diacylglycerol kinase [Bacteroidales bacterium]
MEQKTNKSNTVRLIQSFKYAGQGLMEMMKSQKNARIEILILIITIIVGFIFKIRIYEWISVILASGLVLLAEAFNTAIEKLSNEVSTEKYHPKIKVIKDLAASGVLIAAVCAFVVGFIVFFPHIVRFIVSL